MTILSRPVASSSFQGWETIAGGSNQFLVQQKAHQPAEESELKRAPKVAAAAGLQLAVDYSPFRIIYSTMEVDLASNPLFRAASASPRRQDDAADCEPVRLVVAVADTNDAVMSDWEDIKECWRRAAGGAVRMDEWELFYQGIVRLQREGDEELDPLRKSIAADDDAGPLSDNSSVPEAESSSGAFEGAAQSMARGTSKEDTTAAANWHSGCTSEEVWAARIVGAWFWTDAYQSVLLMCLFAHGYYSRWMSWWTAVVIFYIAGQTFPRYRRRLLLANGNAAAVKNVDSEDDEAGLGMTGAEIRTLVAGIQRWLCEHGLDSAKGAQQWMASIVLINYAMSVFAPNGITLRVLFEEIGCPLIAASLLLSFFYSLLKKSSGVATSGAAKAASSTTSQILAAEPPVPGVQHASDISRAFSPDPVKPIALAPSTSCTPGVTSSGAASFPDIITKPIELYRSSQWKYRLTKEGVVFEEMPSPFCNKKATRFTLTIPKATAQSVAALVCDDPDGTNKNSRAYRFDRLLSGKRIVRRNDDGSVIVQTFYKSPVFGVAARDMVTHLNTQTIITNRADQEALGIVPKSYQQTPSNGETGAVFIQSGLNYGTKHPVESKFCRGAVHIFLLMGQEEKDGSLTLSMTLSVDPQGVIPASVVEMTSVEQVEKMILMRQILAEIGPIHPEPPPQPQMQATAPPVEPEDAPARQTSQDSCTAADEIDDNVRRWVGLFSLKTWTLQQTRDGVSYFLAPSPWCDKKAVRVEMFVPGVKAHALDRVISNQANAKTYDRLLDERRKIRDVNERTTVYHSKYKTPMWGVAPRDFVTKVTPKTYLNEDQQAALGLADIESRTPGAAKGAGFLYSGSDAATEIPPVPKFSRGAVHCFGLFAQEEVLNGAVVGVFLTQVSSTDPCGSIPTSLVDASNVEQMEKLKIIANLMRSV